MDCLLHAKLRVTGAKESSEHGVRQWATQTVTVIALAVTIKMTAKQASTASPKISKSFQKISRMST